MAHIRARWSPKAFAILLALAATLATAQKTPPSTSQPFPRFTLHQGGQDADGLPTSGAKLCVLEGTRSCYQMPLDVDPASGKVRYEFGLDPRSERLHLPGGGSWVFFVSTFSGGGSGTLERLAVLRYEDHAGAGRIVNILPFVAVTNQSQRAMWEVPEVSTYPVLVLADFIWGNGETHFASHFYTVEAWCFDPGLDHYEKALSYRTRRKYPGLDEGDSVHVLGAERPSILQQLRCR